MTAGPGVNHNHVDSIKKSKHKLKATSLLEGISYKMDQYLTVLVSGCLILNNMSSKNMSSYTSVNNCPAGAEYGSDVLSTTHSQNNRLTRGQILPTHLCPYV